MEDDTSDNSTPATDSTPVDEPSEVEDSASMPQVADDSPTPPPIDSEQSLDAAKDEVPSDAPAPAFAESFGEAKQVSSQSAPLPQYDMPAKKSLMAGLYLKWKEKMFSKEQKRFAKIIEFAQKNGKIKNDDVQKLLLVSDKTATRYLDELMEEGKLKRAGSPKNEFYQPN